MQDNFSTNYILKDGQVSPNGLWKSFYNGYGKIESKNGLMNMAPKAVTNVNNTSACLLMSQEIFTDFEATFNMKTVAHTRQGSTPKNWETAWFFFRYTDTLPTGGGEDEHHHYYFYLARNGMLEIGKKDYVKIPGGLRTPDGKNHVCDEEQQQYLLTKNKAVTFALGKSYKIKLVVVGRNIKLWVDDKLLADITDDGTIGYDQIIGKPPLGYPASETMLKGKIGLYCEDSSVQFDNVVVNSITVGPQPKVLTQADFDKDPVVLQSGEYVANETITITSQKKIILEE